MCCSNGSFFHKKSLNMGPISYKISLNMGSSFQIFFRCLHEKSLKIGTLFCHNEQEKRVWVSRFRAEHPVQTKFEFPPGLWLFFCILWQSLLVIFNWSWFFFSRHQVFCCDTYYEFLHMYKMHCESLRWGISRSVGRSVRSCHDWQLATATTSHHLWRSWTRL